MQDTQRAKLDTCNRVKDFNVKHAIALATIPEYAAEVAAFNNAHGIILNAATVQSQVVGANAEAVYLAKNNMAKVVVKYAKRASVKARQLKNVTLANRLDVSLTYIFRAPKTVAVQRANDIKNLLSSNLAALTNITAANITEITNAINAYDTIKEQPVETIQARSAAGTNVLPEAFAAAFTAIENMNDLIDSYFTDVNQPLVDEFDKARQVLNTGIRYTGVEGYVYNNGKPVANASVSIVNTNKTDVTDAEGHFEISKIKPGTYSIEASDEGGNTASKTVQIIKGQSVTVNLQL